MPRDEIALVVDKCERVVQVYACYCPWLERAPRSRDNREGDDANSAETCPEQKCAVRRNMRGLEAAARKSEHGASPMAE